MEKLLSSNFSLKNSQDAPAFAGAALCYTIQFMSSDFLSDFLRNTAQAKVLRVLVSSEAKELTASQIAKRAGVSSQLTTREIKALTKLGVIKKVKPSAEKGNKSKQKDKSDYWILNRYFKHLRSLTEFVQQTSSEQFKNVEQALRGTGRLSAVVLSGIFMGDPSRPADLLVAGDSLNERRLEQAVRGLELMFGREIRYAAFSTPEFRYRLTIQDRLFRDTLDFPHRILLNRAGLFKNS